MEILAPAATAAFLAVPAIVALYLLKVRGPRVGVAGLSLWPHRLADHQANAPWKRVRPSWLLLLQLLIAAGLATALVRPGVAGAAPPPDTTTVVMIDASPSMEATDVAPNRFVYAVERVRRMADRLGPGQQMAVVLLGGHARVLAGPTGDTTVLRSALGRARTGGETGNLDEGISVANALVAGKPRASVILLSDGHTRQSISSPRLSASFRYESVGTTSENVAIEALSRTTANEIFLRLLNPGPRAQERRVELRADGRLVDVISMAMGGRSSAEATWTRLPIGSKVLEARLTPGDALAIDDASWILTEPPRPRRVLLVTEANGFLTRALAIRPNLDVEVVKPRDYKPGPRDLWIFDGFVPDGPLPQPALVIAPPKGKGPVPVGDPYDPGALLSPGPREPLLQYVSLNDVHVQSALSASPSPEWRVVIAANSGPLLLAHVGEPRLAQINFDLHRSDLPLRAAFPLLVHNLLSYLLPDGADSQVLPLGRAISLGTGAGITSLVVTTPDGRSVALRAPFPALFDDTTRAGVYSVTETRDGTTSSSRFVVALQGRTSSSIEPGGAPAVKAAAGRSGGTGGGPLELWPWLALAALVGLVVEWIVFLR